MDKKILKFLQINAHKSTKAMSVLEKRVDEVKIDIVYAQEPNCKDGKIKGIPSDKSVYKCDPIFPPRSGLWFDSRLKFEVLGQFLSRDNAAAVITVEFGTSKKKVVVCSAYFDRERDLPT